MEQKGGIYEETLQGIGNKSHLVKGGDRWPIVISRVAEALRENPIILIWSLSSLRFLRDILVGYVNLKCESDMGYKVKNPQQTEDNRHMQPSNEKSTGQKQRKISLQKWMNSHKDKTRVIHPRSWKKKEWFKTSCWANRKLKFKFNIYLKEDMPGVRSGEGSRNWSEEMDVPSIEHVTLWDGV